MREFASLWNLSRVSIVVFYAVVSGANLRAAVWQNTSNPSDVDASGVIAPRDALIDINRLNLVGLSLPSSGSGSASVNVAPEPSGLTLPVLAAIGLIAKCLWSRVRRADCRGNATPPETCPPKYPWRVRRSNKPRFFDSRFQPHQATNHSCAAGLFQLPSMPTSLDCT
jgi:hypothetical protein